MLNGCLRNTTPATVAAGWCNGKQGEASVATDQDGKWLHCPHCTWKTLKWRTVSGRKIAGFRELDTHIDKQHQEEWKKRFKQGRMKV